MARGGDLAHDLEDLVHGRGLADDFVQAELALQLLPQGDVFGLQVPVAQGAGDAHFQFVNLQAALVHVVVGPAVFHRLDRQFLRAVGGHEDADRRLGQGLGAGDEFQTVLLRQAEICQ